MLYRFSGLEKRSPEFRRAYVAMCEDVEIDPNHLGAVITTESGWDPHIANVYHQHVLKRPIDKCAYGLCQFMPSLLRHYGTSATELSQHDAIWQLQFVRRFYSVHRGRIKTPGQAYMGTFLPAFMAKPADFVLGVDNGVTAKVDEDGCLILAGAQVGVTGGDPLGYGLRLGAVYEQNSGFDLNRDGVIVVGEVTATAERNYEQARARGTFDDVHTADTEPAPAPPPDDEEPPPTDPSPDLATVAATIPYVYSTPESRAKAREDYIKAQDAKGEDDA